MTDLTLLVEEAARAGAKTQCERAGVSFDAERAIGANMLAFTNAALHAFHNPDSPAAQALVEVMARGIRKEMGPAIASPEYLATPGNVERLEARQQAAAEKHARAALAAISRALSSKDTV